VHQPSGEEDCVQWQIWPFEVVEHSAESEAEQSDLFDRCTSEAG
jgi:hypothetical protein